MLRHFANIVCPGKAFYMRFSCDFHDKHGIRMTPPNEQRKTRRL